MAKKEVAFLDIICQIYGDFGLWNSRSWLYDPSQESSLVVFSPGFLQDFAIYNQGHFWGMI